MTAEPAANPVRTRGVGTIFPDDDAMVTVEHIFLHEGTAGPCRDCGKPAHDPGMVGLTVTENDEDEPRIMLMSAADALVLANRLQRAASLVLESQEDNPDLEREAARYGQVPDVPPQEGRP